MHARSDTRAMRASWPLLLALLLAGCTFERAPPDARDGGDPRESTRGAAPSWRDPECPRVHVDPPSEPTRVGEPVRFAVRVENCSAQDVDDEGSRCERGAPGLLVMLALPGGASAVLAPSDAPAPADASWSGCDESAQRVRLAAGETATHAFAWDGRVDPYCPHRVSDQACHGAREPAPGVHALTASFSWGAQTRHDAATLLLVDDATRRVPLVVVELTYEKSRLSAELPARGEGCADFALVREPWTATARRADAAEATAVVAVEVPQGGYGTFGPDALALRPGAFVSLPSAFDPGRVLGVIEDTPQGPALAGRPLAEGPQRVSSAYDVEWQGETYHVTETVEARLAGDAWLFAGGGESGC